MGGKNYKALIVFLCCLVSCVKDKPPAVSNTLPGATGNVYVVCEGSYGNGNASLYAYNPKQDSVFGDIYMAVNNAKLGDVFQSMQHIGNKLFLCVNNSNKVIVLNAANWTVAAALSIPQPRYILPVTNTKAYVSTLYSNLVYIINPQTMQVTGSIGMPAQNAENMCLYYDNVFAASWDTAGNKIFKINTNTDQVTNSISVAGDAPQEILLDKDQTLWVLAGNEPARAGTLTHLDPSTGAILRSYYFPAAVYPLKPVFNNTKDTLYFIEANYYGGSANNGIYRMSVYDTVLPQTPFLQAVQNQYFYALGVDPLTGYIYIGDPKGFVQKGSVYIYNPQGARLKSFEVGLGPGHFYFDE